MRTFARRFLVLALAGIGLAVVPAQETRASAPEGPKVAIVGASVSAGFKDGPATRGPVGNETVPLVTLFRARFDGARVANYSVEGMFLDADGIGEGQIKHVLRLQPDLLVGIDFLFWFAYGAVPADKDEAEHRKQHLDQGLAMLARCECPMLIGDLPDMRGAAARMLNPAWIPAPALLAKLNEQLAAWAKERKNVRLFPLTAEVKALKETGVVLPLADGPLKTGAGDLLQSDRLHANRLGMAWLGLRLDQEIARMLPKDSALAAKDGAKWKLENYIEAAGAGPDLEAARAKAREPAKKEAVPAGKGG
jgi:hypothetical protein